MAPRNPWILLGVTLGLILGGCVGPSFRPEPAHAPIIALLEAFPTYLDDPDWVPTHFLPEATFHLSGSGRRHACGDISCIAKALDGQRVEMRRATVQVDQIIVADDTAQVEFSVTWCD
jgi:hypothetical protein